MRTLRFEVVMESNKPMIKEAVEALFGVKVKAVNTTITKGKVKRFRGQMGRRKDVKKAYVTLEEGNTIDVSTGLRRPLDQNVKRLPLRGPFLFWGRIGLTLHTYARRSCVWHGFP